MFLHLNIIYFYQFFSPFFNFIVKIIFFYFIDAYNFITFQTAFLDIKCPISLCHTARLGETLQSGGDETAGGSVRDPYGPGK
uniref:Uncharacterized protein n=1 Tax=Poecilia latipinna TaxID=48699 RepID=A0A3B3TWQ9_9TELE